MKKILILAIAAIIPLAVAAQEAITPKEIYTKKVKIADFTEKVTKIVLTGRDFFDLSLQGEVEDTWKISPYEFCTWEEFETLKSDDSYYFLITTKDRFKRESAPGVQFITLLKGGEGADKGIEEMLEVVSMPIASAKEPSGREFIFLPALLDIIQEHAVKAIESDIAGYAGLTNHTDNIQRSKGMKIVFAQTDLSSQVKDTMFDKDMVITDEEEADGFMDDKTKNMLVSFVVAPTGKTIGSYCYKMLIDAETHELYYFRRHRISRKDGVGFLAEDMKKIASHR